MLLRGEPRLLAVHGEAAGVLARDVKTRINSWAGPGVIEANVMITFQCSRFRLAVNVAHIIWASALLIAVCR